MVQPLREQSLLVVSERQKGSAQGRILGGPRGAWPTLFLWKFENYFYRILACFPATGFLNFLDPPPASADRLEQNLGDKGRTIRKLMGAGGGGAGEVTKKK